MLVHVCNLHAIGTVLMLINNYYDNPINAYGYYI